jgi:hypothetical protein
MLGGIWARDRSRVLISSAVCEGLVFLPGLGWVCYLRGEKPLMFANFGWLNVVAGAWAVLDQH